MNDAWCLKYFANSIFHILKSWQFSRPEVAKKKNLPKPNCTWGKCAQFAFEFGVPICVVFVFVLLKNFSKR